MSLFMLICREICFVAIYAVLAQNLFCRDLRTFVWRKIYSEIVRVEKKGQISGMILENQESCNKGILKGSQYQFISSLEINKAQIVLVTHCRMFPLL